MHVYDTAILFSTLTLTRQSIDCPSELEQVRTSNKKTTREHNSREREREREREIEIEIERKR